MNHLVWRTISTLLIGLEIAGCGSAASYHISTTRTPSAAPVVICQTTGTLGAGQVHISVPAAGKAIADPIVLVQFYDQGTYVQDSMSPPSAITSLLKPGQTITWDFHADVGSPVTNCTASVTAGPS
jgi:hypothetical protein